MSETPGNDRVARIRAALEAALQPSALDVVDDSHKHVGHAGARDGRGHYSVRIVSAAFDGRPLLARHRLVYGALGDMMTTDVHALALQTLTAAEAAAQRQQDRR